MKLTPIQGPGVPDPGIDVAKARATRDAVVAKIQGLQDSPVSNPTKVQAEEMGAIRQRAQPREITQEEPHDHDSLPSVSTSDTQDEEPASPKSRDVSRELSMLAKRERALREQAQRRMREIKTREQELATREQQIQGRSKEYETNYIPKTALKDNPLQVLADAGVTYEELTNQILNQTAVNPQAQAAINELRNEIKALKQANEEIKTSKETEQSSQYKAAVKQIRKDASDLVKQDPSFELIKATGSINDVVELITRTYDQQGIMLGVEEAAAKVEQYLERETEKLTRTNKLRQRFASQQGQKSQKQDVRAEKQPSMKTLTNANTRTRELDARQRAVLAFKGQLTE